MSEGPVEAAQYVMELKRRAESLAQERDALRDERDQLRELLVSAEGYALANGADRPFAWMFAEDAPVVKVIERAGCYPRNARQEHPGRFWLNPPPDAGPSDAYPEDYAL